MTIDEVIGQRAVRTVFQPLIELNAGQIRGFEALTRGPAGELESPRALFSAAATAGRLVDLERLCWNKALEYATAGSILADRETLLFLNARAIELLDPTAVRWAVDAAQQVGLEPNRIVIELSESMEIEDFAEFRRRLARFRLRGFRIAIDDVGSGHAGLQTITELEPDFIKLDRVLINGIDRNPRRYAAVEAMVLFASRSDTVLVAEGIETPGELAALREIGISWAQGYLLGMPEPMPSVKAVEEGVRLLISELRPNPCAEAMESRIGSLVRGGPVVSKDTQVSAVLDLLVQTGVEALMVVDEERPVALVRRTRLMELLAQPFGRDVYLRRNVELVAETNYLTVDAKQTLEEVSRQAMARHADSVYNAIAVTSDSRFAGVVSVRQLLDAITGLRIEAARHANPLTGLPGNETIESVLRGHLESPEPIAVLHIDLDHFKAFNDAEGFHRGDEVIRFTASLINEILVGLGGPRNFLGHIGGDDFLALVEPDVVNAVSAEITRRFRQNIHLLHSDPAPDWPSADNKRAETRWRPQPSLDITVATTVIDPTTGPHYASVLDTLAEAKRLAKALSRATAEPSPGLVASMR